jgi:antitoxin VapB
MGQLDIKDGRLVADAKALAELLGTSAAEAVRRAVQEKPARERIGRDEEKRRRYEAIMAVSERASKLFPPGASSDHSDLYDENGLPK